MAQKKQKDKADLVFEYVGILPVNEIAMSDNMETRPKSAETQFVAPQFTLEAQKLVRRLHWWSELRTRRN